MKFTHFLTIAATIIQQTKQNSTLKIKQLQNRKKNEHHQDDSWHKKKPKNIHTHFKQISKKKEKKKINKIVISTPFSTFHRSIKTFVVFYSYRRMYVKILCYP